jgi:hypothetical protein
MALRSTQPVTEMSTTDTSWGGDKGGRCLRLTVLRASCADYAKAARSSFALTRMLLNVIALSLSSNATVSFNNAL